MIILYTGTPGSGKSYHATSQVWNLTKKHINVIANFVINLPEKQQEYFYFMDNKQIKVKKLIEFSREHHKENKEGQTCIILDEAGIMFNSKTSTDKQRDEWIKFFSQHRKFGFDVIMIAQNDRMLDRQVRAQIEYQYLHRKLQNFGIKGFFIRLLKGGAGFVCVHQWYTVKEKIGVDYFRIRKKVAKSYDTFGLFDYASSISRFGGLISAADFNKLRKENENEENCLNDDRVDRAS